MEKTQISESKAERPQTAPVKREQKPMDGQNKKPQGEGEEVKKNRNRKRKRNGPPKDGQNEKTEEGKEQK